MSNTVRYYEQTGRAAAAKEVSSPAVARAVQVLRVLARRSYTFSELSRETKIPKSSLHAIVTTLFQCGFVEQRGRSLTLGFQLFALGSSYTQRMSLGAAFRVVARSIQPDLDETMHVGVRDGNEVIHVANLEGRKAVRYVAREGERLPANATALGKVMLAFLPDADVVSLFPHGLPRLTSRTVTSMPKFLQQLRRIRVEGYAVDYGEVDPELRCVAAPIFGPQGETVAAFAIAAPAFRLRSEHFPAFISAATHAGVEISRRLGYVGETPQTRKSNAAKAAKPCAR